MPSSPRCRELATEKEWIGWQHAGLGRLRAFAQASVLMGDGWLHRLFGASALGRFVVEVGDREGALLRRSMSDGVIYWVPEIHWRFDIVGLGGGIASGLKILS